MRRQDLAGRLGDVGSASGLDRGGAVGRVVQRPADVEAVEGRKAGVEEERDRCGLRVGVHLACVLGLDRGEQASRGGCLRLRGAEQVGLAADHRVNGFVGCAADLEQTISSG